MPEVNGRTLMMAVQAVDAKMLALAQALDEAGEDAATDLEDLLLAYALAAEDLRAAYTAAQALADNLPAYEKLVAAGKPS